MPSTFLAAINVWDLIKNICLLPGGIAVFLLGMKMMGDGLEKGAGKSVKKLFGRIGGNRFAGVGIGAGTTAVIQSSSATTVMVVGFVNAGVMTLVQAVSIIMGANIGTTVTAFLGVFSELPVSAFFMASGLVGVFMYMFAKKDRVRFAGEIVTGLAIIFVGMKLMGDAFNDAAIKEPFMNMFIALSENPVGPLLLVLIGALFTGLIQSSSATTVMVVDMVAKGIIPTGAALFIVMGANIGTCVTAVLASIGASTNAKRAALIHLMFNLFGVLLFVPIIWPLRTQVAGILETLAPGVPALQVAFFHLFFNLITTAVLIGLIKQLVWIAQKAIRDKTGEEPEELKLYFIDDRVRQSPPQVADSILKETLHMAELARENLDIALKAVLDLDLSQKNRVVYTEQKINFINKGIGRYLVTLSADSVPADREQMLGSLHSVISDIERIGDHAIDFIDEAAEMKERGEKFSASAAGELSGMLGQVDEMFVRALDVFKTRDAKRLPEIAELEKGVDETKHELGFGHIKRLNKGECTVESGAHFYAVITALERVADHLANVAFAIKSTDGAQLEDLKQRSKELAKQRSARKKVYW